MDPRRCRARVRNLWERTFFPFFFAKVVGKLLPCGASPRATPCPGRSCCSPCALVEPFVTVFSSQPLALPDRTVHSRSFPSPPLVPLPETHSKPLRLLHRSRYRGGHHLPSSTRSLFFHAIELFRFLSEEPTYAATWNSVNSFEEASRTKESTMLYYYYYATAP